jgi:outer membrane immunogenic protein
MRRLLMATAASVAVLATVPALAGDGHHQPMCGRGPFSGFYAGLNFGGGTAHSTTSFTDGLFNASNFTNPVINRQSAGAVAGGQLGWGIQCSAFYWGLETDFNFAGFDARRQLADDIGFRLDTRSSVDWFGTLRTRTGLAVDNVMVYMTGGLAYTKVGHQLTITDTNAPLSASFSDTTTKWGYTVGGGIEGVFGKFTLRTEALYVDTRSHSGSFSLTPFGATPALGNTRIDDNFWVTRIGISHKFGQ